VILLLMPRGMPWRYLALPLCLPLLLPSQPTPAPGQFWLRVFDVGQGLSVLIQTQDHALLYDTGPGQEDGWNAGEAILLPALARLGIARLDRLIISHTDNDHIGGLAAIRARFPQLAVSGSEELLALADGASVCAAGDSWHWDGVTFEILHPVPGLFAGAKRNNQSCVLRIDNGRYSVLLPGDIETRVERWLALTYKQSLQSDVLIAPHHGSATSSSYPLLKMVAADWVVYSSGYRNGFSHPAAQITARYGQFGSRQLNTAAQGMVSFRWLQEGFATEVEAYRHKQRRYWRWSGNRPACRYC